MNTAAPPEKVAESKRNGSNIPPPAIETNGAVAMANGKHDEIEEAIAEEIVEDIVDDIVEGIVEDLAANGKPLDQQSPRRMTLTHGDPLGALDVTVDDIPLAKVCISDNFVVTPDPSMRLFAGHHSSEESEDDEQPYDDNQTPKLSLR